MKGFFTLTLVSLFLLILPFAQSQIMVSSHHDLDWKVYPNPFFNTFTVSSFQKDLQVEVFTLAGEQLPSTIFRYHDGEQVQYQTGLELSKGIYLVTVTDGQAYRCYKMMKL